MDEIAVELISEKCNECPRLELETQFRMGTSVHRCKNLQLCREVLGFWTYKNRFEELKVTSWKEDEKA